jgi:hypothetical protein
VGILVEIISDLIGIPGAIKRRSLLAFEQPVTEAINRRNVIHAHFPDVNRLATFFLLHRYQNG